MLCLVGALCRVTLSGTSSELAKHESIRKSYLGD